MGDIIMDVVWFVGWLVACGFCSVVRAGLQLVGGFAYVRRFGDGNGRQTSTNPHSPRMVVRKGERKSLQHD